MPSSFLPTAINNLERVIIFSLDTSYRYTSFTQSHFATMKQIWGVEIKLGTDMLAILKGRKSEDYLKAKENFDKALTGERFSKIEEYGSKKLNRSFWENHYGPVLDENKKIIGLTVLVIDISDRTELIDKIKDTNDRLALAVKAANIGIWVWDMVTQDVFWSDEILKIYNLDESYRNISFEKYLEFVHPEDVQLLKADINKAIEEKSNYFSRHRVYSPSGDLRWVEGMARIILDNEKPVKMIGTVIDITDQMKLVTENKEASSLLQAALESTADGILVVDNEGTISVYNQKFLSIYDFTSEEAKNQPDAVLLEKAIKKIVEPEKFYAKVQELYANPELESNDMIRLTDGKILNRFSKPQRIGDKIVGRVWSFRDITEQKKIEQNLIESENRFRTLQEASFGGIGLHDQGKILDANKGLSDLTGYSHDELLKMDGFSLISPDTLHIVKENIALNSEQPYDVIGIRKNGTRYNLEIQGRAMPYAGKMIRVAEFRDVTPRKQSEQQILEQNSKLTAIADDLKNKNQQLEEFTQIVSHNLRSPVSNILTLLDFYDKSKSDEERNSYIKMLRESGDKMLGSLHELNEVLKINQNKDIERQNLSFEKVLGNIKQQLSSQITKTGAVIKTDFTITEILYPNIYLESILINLLSNALKYMHPDRSPEILFKTYASDDAITLTVKDNGLGLDLKKYGHQIFKLRKTFHKHPESRGIGLFMIKNQIEAMGGDIHISSKENVGTEFIVNFNQLLKT